MTDNQPLKPGNGGEVRPVGPSTANDAFWGPRPGGDRLVPVGGAVGPTPAPPVLPNPRSR
jgi:hypothetical protein